MSYGEQRFVKVAYSDVMEYVEGAERLKEIIKIRDDEITELRKEVARMIHQNNELDSKSKRQSRIIEQQKQKLLRQPNKVIIEEVLPIFSFQKYA